jgi:hypothetical protein
LQSCFRPACSRSQRSHAYWGLGGYWPAASAEHLAKAVVGTPGVKRMAKPGACLAVAAMPNFRAEVGAAAAWPLFAIGLLPQAWPRRLGLLAGLAIGAVFVGKGLAGYTPAWRGRFREQPFASLDRRAYSPQCLLLGAIYIALVIEGPIP